MRRYEGHQWSVPHGGHTSMQFHIEGQFEDGSITELVEMLSKDYIYGYARSEELIVSERIYVKLEANRIVVKDGIRRSDYHIDIQGILDRIMEQPEYKDALLRTRLEEL